MKIKLSELREFVKSIINEQTGENTKKYSTPLKMTFKDSSGEIYKVGSNVMGFYDITEEYAVPNGTVYISTKNPNVKIQYMGLTKTFYINKIKVFNPVYAKDLDQRFFQTGGATPDIAAKRFIGQSIRFYEDVANTKEKFVIKVTNVVKNNAGILISGTSNYGEELFTLKCKDNFVKTLKRSESVPMLYNKKFIDDLKKIYCTTSAGGTPVTNIGKYSQVDQKAPMDVAEIRKIVKALVKEQTAPAAPQPDVNWQKIYPALKAYKNPLAQNGTYNGKPFQQLQWGIGANEYWIEFVWDLSISNTSLSFESLDNQNLKTFESLVSSLDLPTDSKNYMRKSTTKDGKPAVLIMYHIDSWSKYDPNTVISTVKKIIDSMQGKAVQKK